MVISKPIELFHKPMVSKLRTKKEVNQSLLEYLKEMEYQFYSLLHEKDLTSINKDKFTYRPEFLALLSHPDLTIRERTLATVFSITDKQFLNQLGIDLSKYLLQITTSEAEQATLYTLSYALPKNRVSFICPFVEGLVDAMKRLASVPVTHLITNSMIRSEQLYQAVS
eukprot:TRINITY_DN11184_c0_g1_i1.p1 TRINITY_DN11184_c0_g1~~TRINITY_DN11184_c0_g1_i1.p1  ORF type:complete len:168 (+),score=25.60 TRINITY_DN11184_c0_g1_i1:347-850(+)